MISTMNVSFGVQPLLPSAVINKFFSVKPASDYREHPDMPEEMRASWRLLGNTKVPYIKKSTLNFHSGTPVLRRSADFLLPVQLRDTGNPLVYPPGHKCAGKHIQDEIYGRASRGIVLYDDRLSKKCLIAVNNEGVIIMRNITDEHATWIMGALELIASQTGQDIGKVTTEELTSIINTLIDEHGVTDMRSERIYLSPKYSKNLSGAKPARPGLEHAFTWTTHGQAQRVGFLLFTENAQTISHALMHVGPLVFRGHSSSKPLFFLGGCVLVKTDKRQTNQNIIHALSFDDFVTNWVPHIARSTETAKRRPVL
jgi:hypothetical protein